MKKKLITLFIAAAISTPVYVFGNSSTNIRQGYDFGVGLNDWQPDLSQSKSMNTGLGFSSRAVLGCNGIDFNLFLARFDVDSLVDRWKAIVTGSIKSAAVNYMLTLAYSNPTIATVLDMLNGKYDLEFSAFTEQCNAERAQQIGESQASKQRSEAEQQCFEYKMKTTSQDPAQILNSCKDSGVLGSIKDKLSSGKELKNWMKQYSNLNITRETEILIGMLPETRIGSNGVEFKAPEYSFNEVASNIAENARNDLTSRLNGSKELNNITACTSEDYIKKPSMGKGCIPKNAMNVVNPTIIKSVSQLSPESQSLFVEALSGQVGALSLRTSIADMQNQINQLGLDEQKLASADASGDIAPTGEEMVNRKKDLNEKIVILERQAEALLKVSDAKSNLARTQVIAYETHFANVARSRDDADKKNKANNSLFGGFIKTITQ